MHDGSPVNAAIVADTLRKVHGGAGAFSQVPVAGIEPDGQDVVIRLSKPFAALQAYLVNFTTIILAPSSFDASGKVERIVGSGPYRVKSLTHGNRIETDLVTGQSAIVDLSYACPGKLPMAISEGANDLLSFQVRSSVSAHARGR